MIAGFDQHLAGRLAQSQADDDFAIGAQLARDRAEVAVAGHEEKDLDLWMGERGFQRIDHHLDVGGVFAMARAVAEHLRQFDGVSEQILLIAAVAGPIAVGAADDAASPLLGRFHDHIHLAFAVNLLGGDGDVLKVDKDGDLAIFLFGGLG